MAVWRNGQKKGSFGAVAAVALLLAGCASTPVTTRSAAPLSATKEINVSSDDDQLDPADAAFVAKLRFQGLAPASFPDAVYITDANAVCQILALARHPTSLRLT